MRQECDLDPGSYAGAVEEERARRAAAARAYAEELEGLSLKPVSAWPAPVRALVRQREAAAAEVCALSLDAACVHHTQLMRLLAGVCCGEAALSLSGV